MRQIKFYFTIEQSRVSTNVRTKKAASNINASKKNISIVKEEDEDGIEEVNIINLFFIIKV